MNGNRLLKILLVFTVLIVAVLGLAACGSTATTTATVTAPAMTTTATVTAPAVTTTATTTMTAPAVTMTVTAPAMLPGVGMRPLPNKAGNYLVDMDGRTLYYFTNDAMGMSNASSAVVANWPIFYVPGLMVPAGMDATDFGSITRSDGAMQTTFRGWPLYYYVGDPAPGDMNGQGINDVWFTVDPARFMAPKNFSLVSGWYKGQDVSYYDFGANTPLTGNGDMVQVAPIYALITGMDSGGNPVFVDGQHNIIDTLPGDPGYSDLWNVVLVTVPQNYVANSIRSVSELANAGFDMMTTDILVNCPVVPAGSTLATGKTLVQGWYRDVPIYYADFGPNPAEAATIYAFITGMDAQGNPMFVSGQRNIIDVKPGDAGYTAFWDVHLVTVPSSYVANTFTSFSDVMSSGYPVADPGIAVNCPVVTP